jgi:hypothetical protein
MSLAHLALVGAREYVVRATRTGDQVQAQRAQRIVDLIDRAVAEFKVEEVKSQEPESQWEPPNGWPAD